MSKLSEYSANMLPYITMLSYSSIIRDITIMSIETLRFFFYTANNISHNLLSRITMYQPHGAIDSEHQKPTSAE